MATDPVSEARRVPDNAEIRSLLERYFVGPIDDLQVARIEKRLHEVLASVGEQNVESQAYYANNVHDRGLAWREELSYGQRAPRNIDLVPWLASRAKDFPPPRPYCPDPFVGTWESPGGRWVFSVDGQLKTEQRELATKKSWCIVRRSTKGFAGDYIHLTQDRHDNPTVLIVASIKPAEMELEPYGGDDVRFRLRRTS